MNTIPAHEEAIEFDPVNIYTNKIIKYLEVKHGYTHDKAIDKASEIVANNLKDPEIAVYHRPDGEDTHLTTRSLLNMIKDVYKNKRVMSPSGTVYEDRNKRLSFISKQLEYWMGKRSIVKKASFKYAMQGDTKKAAAAAEESVKLKKYSNSVSGLVTSGSHVHCKSIHYTLTSTTAMASAIANGTNERFISGNYHFKDTNTVIDYCLAITTNYDREAFINVCNKYNLHIPTVEEFTDTIMDSVKPYRMAIWTTKRITDFLANIEDYDRAAIIYMGSLYNVMKYNKDFVMGMISDYVNGAPVFTEDLKPVDYLAGMEEDLINAAHHRPFETLRGVMNGYKKKVGDDTIVISDEDIETVAKYTKGLFDTLENHSDFVNTVLLTNIMPPDPAYMTGLVRKCVVLSDTDSTCYTMEEWVDIYSNHVEAYEYEPSLGVMSFVGLLASRCVKENLKVYSRNMGVRGEHIYGITMKSEFTWSVFLRAANAAKHYLADTIVQEGNIYPKSKLEVKGVGFKGSNNSQLVLDTIYELATDLMGNITTNTVADIKTYVKKYEDLLVSLKEGMLRGDSTLLSGMVVKRPENYTNPDPYRSNCRYLLTWNALFGNDYHAEYDEIFYKLSTKITSPKALREFLEDYKAHYPPEQYEHVVKEFTKLGRKNLITFYIPSGQLQKGKDSLPPFLIKYLALDQMAAIALSPMRALLETLGYWHPDILLK